MNHRAFVVLIAAAIVGLAPGCRPRSASTPPAPAAAVVETVNRGVSLMGQYDYDGAAKAFEEALADAPNLSDVKVNLAIARFNRGRKENQDLEQAVSLLDAVLQQEPTHTRAWYFKGIILQHQGHAEAAIPCFETVLQQRPNDGVAWYLLGMCKQRIGQDAGKELLRSIELRPYLVSAYYRLWQTLQAAGETVRAAPFLEQFKQLRESPLAETIELPQYNQMGELALVVPIGHGRPTLADPSRYRAGQSREVFEDPRSAPDPQSEPLLLGPTFGGAAFADTDRDGQIEILLSGWPTMAFAAGLRLEANPVNGSFSAFPFLSGTFQAVASFAYAIGDYDNDESPDLFVVGARTNALFRGSPEGRFTPVTDTLADPATGGRTRSALWLDADHDGDLDLFVCNAGAPNQLFNNNSDGTFTDIAGSTDLAVPEGNSVMVLPGDLDGDRDMDLVLLRANAPAKVFLNELSGKFREITLETEIHGDLGGVLQDFNGDGPLDLLVLGGEPAELKVFLGDGHARFKPSESFAESVSLLSDMGETPMPPSTHRRPDNVGGGAGILAVGFGKTETRPKSATAAESIGSLRGIRVADVDLDGDLDIAAFGREGHLLLNDGTGRFTPQLHVWTASPGTEIAGAELVDLTGDLVPDLLLLERGTTSRLLLVPGELSPSSTAIGIAPTGVRSRDKRTRSPASGYGVALTVRAGLQEQSRLSTGQSGGFNQSPLPLVFGLSGASRADYVRLAWPDGVVQVESALPAGRHHIVAETQRKVSSCPVLFTWNGNRFEVITDFAGVGGLGYLAAPGEYVYPTPVDHVKIEPHQLRARDGFFELRITEPMEESAYFDRLELLAIDHPVDWKVFPDERLTVTGPAPTRELLVIEKPLFAERALNPAGADCTDELKRTDRRYAFEPVLDRRFIGFCERHTVELDFGDQLVSLRPDERVFLFINGYLEYPYSQTTYAASQARLGWEPIRVEQQQRDGQWQTIVPDAGALGGASRTMTVDLTGLVGGAGCRLRLTSNLEIFYDQIFLGVPLPLDRVKVHALPVAEADLRYVGIAREVSPDGRLPLIYDYDQTDVTVPFDTLRGAYTRYGPVRELLQEFDDLFVLVGTGDEIAARFDASKLPALPDGTTRSFVLVSHAYCKDMDPYTATPQTLDPMPFRGMSRYPYPAEERPPETEAQRRIRDAYETRIVE